MAGSRVGVPVAAPLAAHCLLAPVEQRPKNLYLGDLAGRNSARRQGGRECNKASTKTGLRWRGRRGRSDVSMDIGEALGSARFYP